MSDMDIIKRTMDRKPPFDFHFFSIQFSINSTATRRISNVSITYRDTARKTDAQTDTTK
jgi:hypothetical protein